MANNKIVFGNETLMDLTQDSVDASKVLLNETFHDKSGTQQSGTLDPYVPTDSAETAIVDNDYFPFYDTSASGKRKTLWSNIKAKLKTYFDTIYSTFSGSYNDLDDKPTIPTVNNGQLTIQQNGTNKATFTANQSGNVTANIITDIWTPTATVSSNGTVTFSGLNDSYGYSTPFYELPSGDSAYTFSKVNKTGSGTSVTLTFTTDAPSGTVCKLRILK